MANLLEVRKTRPIPHARVQDYTRNGKRHDTSNATNLLPDSHPAT
jgi:hypothetical protein